MQILVLNYEYPPIGGGAGVISRHIAEGLAALGYGVTVVTAGYGDLPAEEMLNDVRIIRVNSRRKLQWQSNPREMYSWIIKSKGFLRKHLKETSYDLCFAHFAMPGGEVAYSMQLEFSLPYVLMSHGHDLPWFFPKQMWFYHMLTYFWIRKIVWNSKGLFVQSDDMQRNAELFAGEEKKHLIHQIPNGWDADFFYPDKTKKSKDFEILFPGRLVKQKDPMTVLKAMETVLHKLPDAKLRIAGDGSMRKQMEKWIASRNIQNSVSFEGWVSKSGMRDLYQSASMVVLPSLNEGMSMASLEAMACGAYVIVTDVSRNTVLIEEGVNGNLVEMSNPDDLAQKILDFYSIGFSKDYSIPAESVQRLQSVYSWEKVVSQYNDVLKTIL